MVLAGSLEVMARFHSKEDAFAALEAALKEPDGMPAVVYHDGDDDDDSSTSSTTCEYPHIACVSSELYLYRYCKWGFVEVELVRCTGRQYCVLCHTYS